MMKNTAKTCPCEGDTAPRFLHPAVLAVLDRGPRHGYDIHQELGSSGLFGCAPPAQAGVYRALKDMVSKGLCTTHLDPNSGGPARQVYTLTEQGRSCLVRWGQTLEELRGHIGQLIAYIGA